MTTTTPITTPQQLADLLGLTPDAIRGALSEISPDAKWRGDRNLTLKEAALLRARYAARLNGTAKMVQGVASEAEAERDEAEAKALALAAKLAELEGRMHEAERKNREAVAKMHEAERSAGEVGRELGEAQFQVETLAAKLAEAENRLDEMARSGKQDADFPVLASRIGLWAITVFQVVLVLVGGYARYGAIGLSVSAIPCVFLIVLNITASDGRFWQTANDGLITAVGLAVVFGFLHYFTLMDVVNIASGKGWFCGISALVIEAVALAALNTQIKISQEK